MGLVLKGVMQAPVTPLHDDFSLDLPTLEKVTDFHVRTGATGITWPYHKSESLNMTIAERKAGAEAVIRTVNKRVPVAIHVSSLAVRDTIELARHAQEHGADCVVAITPYFWDPTPQSIFDFFVRLGTSIDLPFMAYNSPGYLSGVEITSDLLARMIERLPNLIGVKEASFNSEKFLELSRRALAMKPDFSLIAGVEYLLPSIPLGGRGSYSSAGAICPNRSTTPSTPKSGEQLDQIAPIDAAASMAITASGIFGRKPATRSPATTPMARKAAATRATSVRSASRLSSRRMPRSSRAMIAASATRAHVPRQPA